MIRYIVLHPKINEVDTRTSILIHWFVRTLLSFCMLGTYGCVSAPEPALKRDGVQPNFEDYATIESYCKGVPVYSLGNITYLYGSTPDLLPGVVMQEGNTHPISKLRLKKSWEIEDNLCGATPAEPAVRSMWNDDQPLLPIHLIDGDPNTVWSSYGSMVEDERPEWIRIDLPVESPVASVALVTSAARPPTWHPNSSGLNAGQILPKDITIMASCDNWHWEKVYENKDFSGNTSGTTIIPFSSPIAAKQVRIVANVLRPMEGLWNWGNAFTISEVEVRDPAGNNLALVSRGAGVAVSSTSHILSHDRFMHDVLFVPVHCDLGFKWIRLGVDNGLFLWNYVEREKGNLRIDPKADDSITQLQRNGLKVIMVLDIKSNWLYNDPPQRVDWQHDRINGFWNTYHNFPGWAFECEEQTSGYLRYVDYMVRHFKGRVAYWELGNECPYNVDLIKATIRTIRKIDPDTPIMLCIHGVPDASDILPVLRDRVDESGVKNGKLAFWGAGRTGVLVEDIQFKDGMVMADLPRDQSGGIILRYKDPDNFLVANYWPKGYRNKFSYLGKMYFHERVNGKWSRYIDAKSIEGLGPDLHMRVNAKGPQISCTITDGTKEVTIHHETRHFIDAGAVGLYQETTFEQTFDDFKVLDPEGKLIFKDEFGQNDGPPAGWKLFSTGPQSSSEPPLATLIDAIGWHYPAYQGDPNCWNNYRMAVGKVRKDCAEAGYHGRFMETEFYENSLYPPGPPEVSSEMQMAKYIGRHMTFVNGMDVMAGYCTPYTVTIPNGQTLFRVTMPVDTVNPIEPNASYYVLRSISTIMDGFHAFTFPVNFDKGKFDCVTFGRGRDELILAAWIPGAASDGVTQIKTTLALPGVKAHEARVIDPLNGTQQELNYSLTDNSTTIMGLLVKDYPTFVRIKTF